MYLWKNFYREAFPTHGVILNIKLHKIWDISVKKFFGYPLPMLIYGQNKEKTLWPKGEKTPKGAQPQGAARNYFYCLISNNKISTAGN